MIKHIIITDLEVLVCIGESSFYAQLVGAVNADVEYTHDMKRPSKVKLPDGAQLRCGMPSGQPVMVSLPDYYDVTDSVDMGKIVQAVVLQRLEQANDELARGLAINGNLEVNHV